MIATDRNYSIEMTGTPPKNMRYQMRSDKGQVKINIQYWSTLSLRVYADE